MAKIFGVKVEEFGIFLPPPIFKKKIGQTQFSINLLPFGAFVKLFGEKELKKEKGSFSALPISKRILIVLGGAFSFWLISFLLFFFLFSTGMPTAVQDEEIVSEPKIQIVEVFENSPAQKANLKMGDEILEVEGEKVEKMKDFVEKVKENLGKEITLKIRRQNKVFQVSLIPRISPPKNQGPIGISIVRVGIKKYPLLESFFKAQKSLFNFTFQIVFNYFLAIKNLISGKKIQLTVSGPVGASFFLWQAFQTGFPYFLNSLAILSLYLAIFNLLPIPALDGGKILFLGIEALRKKPVSRETEEKITFAFLSFLFLLLILATIQDIRRIF